MLNDGGILIPSRFLHQPYRGDRSLLSISTSFHDARWVEKFSSISEKDLSAPPYPWRQAFSECNPSISAGFDCWRRPHWPYYVATRQRFKIRDNADMNVDRTDRFVWQSDRLVTCPQRKFQEPGIDVTSLYIGDRIGLENFAYDALG